MVDRTWVEGLFPADLPDTAFWAVLDPGLTRRLIESYVRQRPSSAGDPVETLTELERGVLIEMIRGRSNQEIGTRLYLAETTVKTHAAAILRKLGLRDRLQAIIYGYEHGLVRSGDNPPA